MVIFFKIKTLLLEILKCMRCKVMVLTVVHSSFDSHGIRKVSPRYGDTPYGQEIVFNAWILQTVICIEQITVNFLGQ